MFIPLKMVLIGIDPYPTIYTNGFKYNELHHAQRHGQHDAHLFWAHATWANGLDRLPTHNASRGSENGEITLW